MDGRVSMLRHGGRTRVLRDDVPSANGITVHRGRLFIGECREGGRLLEFDLGGGAPRVLLDSVPSPNAMEVGPDGLLYFPVMGANEIWRIDLDGGEPQRVAGDLGVPDSVKFDPQGYIVSTQVHSGQVLRIDPRSGEQRVLAQLSPGLDNCTFVGDRLLVSNFTGEITEIAPDGATRTVLPGGLNWPLDLTVGHDGRLYIADGTYFYTALPDGSLQTVGMLFSPGYPGFLRGVVSSGPGEFVVTTSGGQVSAIPAGGERNRSAGGRIRPALRRGDRRLTASSSSPNWARDGCLSSAGGRCRRSARPATCGSRSGVAVGADGACLVAEAGAGRVVKVSGSRIDTIVADLQRPQGILRTRRRALHRRRRRQGVDRVRPEHQYPAHHRVGVAGRTSAGRSGQAAERHAAVLWAAGPVRRHRRRGRRHAVHFGRR